MFRINEPIRKLKAGRLTYSVVNMFELFKRPSELISEDQLQNWEVYSSHLLQYPTVSKYLGDHMKRWVGTIQNPIEVRFIRYLLTDQLKGLEDFLISMEGILGEEQLHATIDEVRNESESHLIFSKKWISIHGEMYVAKRLRQDYPYVAIEKLNTLGDWKVGKVIVSVKSKQGLTCFWESLLDIIAAKYYTAGNDYLSQYGRIGISGTECELGDRPRKDIVTFVRQDFPNIVKFADSCIEARECPVNISLEMQYSRDAMCEIFVNDDIAYVDVSGLQLNNGVIGNVHIELSERYNKYPYVSLVEPHTAYFQREFRLNGLENSVSGWLNKFEKAVDEIDSSENFIGWVIFPIHISQLKNDQPIGSNDVKQILQSVIGSRVFETRISFVPEFADSMNSGSVDFIFPRT